MADKQQLYRRRVSDADVKRGAHKICEIDCCGYSIKGEKVFCDDPRLKDMQDAYGERVWQDTCHCKNLARACLEMVAEQCRIVETYLHKGAAFVGVRTMSGAFHTRERHQFDKDWEPVPEGKL